MQARVTLNIKSWPHSKVLETCLPTGKAGLPVSLPLLLPSTIEKLGVGKFDFVIDLKMTL